MNRAGTVPARSGAIASTAGPRPGHAAAARRYPPRLVPRPGRAPNSTATICWPGCWPAVHRRRPRQRRRAAWPDRVVDWLADQPGQRGSNGGSQRRRRWATPTGGGRVDRLQSGSQRAGASVSVTSNLRVSLLMLICADVIRPSLGWLLTPRAPQNLVRLGPGPRPRRLRRARRLCDASPAGRTMKMAALRRAATILAVKGGRLHEITVGDCLELSLWTAPGGARTGVWASTSCCTRWACSARRRRPRCGRSPPRVSSALPDARPLRHLSRPVRALLLAYLRERQPTVDHTTLRDLAFTLGRLFWRDLELHHPGISSLHLAPEVAAAWKQRVLTNHPHGRPRRTTAEAQSAPRPHQLGPVRAFYLDIAQWAMEDPPAGGRGPRRARSAGRTWPGARRSGAASPAWTSAPENGCRCCPLWSPASAPGPGQRRPA